MKTESIHFWQGRLVAGILAAFAACVPAAGQEHPPPPIAISGTTSLDFDQYGVQSTPEGAAPSRRPASLLRLIVSPVISFGDQFSLPFTFMFTLPETTTMFSRPASPGIGDFLQNPANSFSLAPKFGWAQFNLGTQTPHLSELSGGDIQLFGLGADLAPGKFRMAVAAGTVGRSVEADAASGTRGEFGRQAYMGRLGYVDEETDISLNLVRIRDDGASIRHLTTTRIVQPDSIDPSISDTIVGRDPLMPMPEESFTATLSASLPLVTGVQMKAEVGGSLFTRDMTSQAIGEPIAALKPLMAQRLSTRADIAGKFAVDIAQETWGVSLNSIYVGAGYRTLAYPWMQADRLDLTLAPRIRLLDDDLSLSGSIGWRQNNLSRTEEATTSQLLGSASADARVGEMLAINAQYSNYGMRTPLKNDTLRVETVSQSISITPTITLNSEALTHVITLSAGIDDYTDHNPITGADGSNRTRSVAGMYSASLAAIPLDLDLGGSWLVNRLSAGDMTITSGSVGAGYRLFEDVVTLAANATISRTALAPATADEGVTLRLNCAWRITEALRLRADASTTGYRYGDSRPGTSFRENLLRTSLQWQW